MAKAQYGVIITELKGKVGGQVFQGGNVGKVLRNKGYTAGFSSSNRQGATSKLSANAKRWQTMSGANRATFNAIVASWPFIDKFGNTYTGSGYQVFMAYNNILNSLGLPSEVNAGGASSPTDPGTVVASGAAGPDLELNWGNAGGADDYVAVFCSPPLSAGQNNNHRRYKKVFTSDYNGVTGVSFGAEYITQYGQLVSGMIISVRWSFHNRNFPIASFGGSALVTVP